MDRARAPVFVVGCPRSGTTLLYDMLLSAGNFAIYLAESNVFNLLVPRFGDFSRRATRERLMDSWLHSKLFRASHLDGERLRLRVIDECRNAGGFLRMVMEEMARSQGAERWADNSPEELLYTATIKEQIPNALFIHMIRDGRDVALSLNARPNPWIRPFSRDREKSLHVAGLFWQWIVARGRKQSRGLGRDYLEVHFEDLVADPHKTLGKIGQFIGQELDYDRIRSVAIGSVSDPNTSFKGEAQNPVGRWEKKLSPADLALFETLVGPTLRDLGYALRSTIAPDRWETWRMSLSYRAYFDAKFWFKRSVFARSYFGPMSGTQIDNTVIAVDPAKPQVA